MGMRRFASVLLGCLLVLTACGGGDGFPFDETTPVDESRAVAEAIGLSEAQFEEYESDVALVLGDLEDYWSRVLPELYGIEHVSPSAFIEYHSEEDAPVCGDERVPTGNAVFCAESNYIAWDEANLLMPYFAQVGDFAIAYVLAHEWGHSIQAQVGAQAQAGIFFELQADCYAGAWGADAGLRGMLEPGDVEEGLAAAQSVGDLPGIPWFDPRAHGTPEQRIEAFTVGFREGPFACTELTS
jgi:predicted metalloprotease